jgi:hypothetical protein
VLTHPEQPLPVLVVENAWATLFVGPVAAAVTGKRGASFGMGQTAYDSGAGCGIKHVSN